MSDAAFPTTRWSRVAHAADTASPEARAALAELCRAYWFPVYAFIRRNGHNADDAFDLTQSFFARLLERRTIRAASATRGRFRAFLLADCRFFLADARDAGQAVKRGGGRVVQCLDPNAAETRFSQEPAHRETAERLFDRDWALELIDQALELVAQHYGKTGRSERFQALRPALTSAPDAPNYAELARRLGMTEGSVQVAIHRARARFRQALRELVAATLENPSPGEIDEEIRGLFGALGE